MWSPEFLEAELTIELALNNRACSCTETSGAGDQEC
jgi:hypothetical protein